MIRLIFTALVGGVCFLAWLVVWALAATRWPWLERSRLASLAFFLPAIALAVATYCYVRRRSELISFTRRYRGHVILVGTARKGWHSLFRAATHRPPLPYVTVWWWRDIPRTHPLLAFSPNRPPVSLPFLACISQDGIAYLPAGPLLRTSRGSSLAEQLAHLDRTARAFVDAAA